METVVKNLTEYISEIQKINVAASSSKHLFYRGVKDRAYQLIPKIYRDTKFKERDIVLDYKHYSPQTGANYNFPKDILKMLADMQHYGVPTRLLDWTTSPFVALYFACQDKNNQDGKIYIFNTWKYWRGIIVEMTVADLHEIHIKARALSSLYKNFSDVQEKIQQEFNFQLTEDLLQKPFPFVSSFCNDRIINQKGCFTIHGQCRDSLDSQQTEEISELIILDKHKSKILDELNMFGIDDYSIFPDFEGMKKSFERKGSLFNL